MNKTIIIRGGGDLATGTISCLHQCGYQVLVLEIAKPTAIRRSVAFSEAMYDGETEVEGIKARKNYAVFRGRGLLAGWDYPDYL